MLDNEALVEGCLLVWDVGDEVGQFETEGLNDGWLLGWLEGSLLGLPLGLDDG